MAHTSLHPALTHLRGSLGGLTFRMRPDGQASVFTRDPVSTPASPAQRERRQAFSAAQRYAREVLADPLQRLRYQSLAKVRHRPPNTLLIANYLNPPAIETVDLGHYTGGAGQDIALLASDDLEVASVEVEVRDPGEAILETGSAQAAHGVWRYRTTTDVPAGVSWRVVVTATNRAGHAAILTLSDPRDPSAPPPQTRTRPPTR